MTANKRLGRLLSQISLNLIIILLIFSVDDVLALDGIKTNPLSENISKGYTNKFCNAIGIGMSRESAMKISIMENAKPKYNPSLWIEIALNKNKNINDINQSELIDQVTNSIVKKCGIAINVYKEEEIVDFKTEFNELLKEYKPTMNRD